MTKKQSAADKAFRELAKLYKKSFGVDLNNNPEKGKPFVLTEAGPSPYQTTTKSSRANWLNRRARAHGFQRSSTNPHEYTFVGVEDEPEPEPPNA